MANVIADSLTVVVDESSYHFVLWCDTTTMMLDKATFSKPSILPVRIRLWQDGEMVFTLTGNESVKNGAKPLPPITVIDMGGGQYRLPDNVEAVFEVL